MNPAACSTETEIFSLMMIYSCRPQMRDHAGKLWVHGEDNLADLLVGVQHRMGAGNLGQRKCRVQFRAADVGCL